MTSPFDINVALRRPPHSLGAGTSNAIHVLTTDSDASTPAVDLLRGAPLSYVVLRFEALSSPLSATDVIGYCACGPAGMPPVTAGAGDGAGWPITHGEIWEWCAIDPFDRWIKLIRAGATNVRARFYLSDRRE